LHVGGCVGDGVSGGEVGTVTGGCVGDGVEGIVEAVGGGGGVVTATVWHDHW